jgi:hypothetical protein
MLLVLMEVLVQDQNHERIVLRNHRRRAVTERMLVETKLVLPPVVTTKIRVLETKRMRKKTVRKMVRARRSNSVDDDQIMVPKRVLLQPPPLMVLVLPVKPKSQMHGKKVWTKVYRRHWNPRISRWMAVVPSYLSVILESN